jgi:non-specific serine/threonine protein kinase
MGEVYLARDPRLERDVALKMLPAAFTRDPERVALFRREALALAAVNHPNIATIFGFEESESGALILVLECIEGESLAERLRRGALPLTEALRVCGQIAEAVEAAHARGVIHRDLKPANVMLGPLGMVKVLDFGLAHSTAGRTAPAHDSMAPTWLAPALPPGATAAEFSATEVGTPDATSSGTPGYMSPEQIRGETQDSRTDMFALGCLLYECLSGRRAFSGADARELMDAVLEQTPDETLLPPETPPPVRELIAHCLEKDAARRLDSARAARVMIEELLGIRRAAALRTGEEIASSPNNLPPQPTRFIGRERELRDCLALLQSTRLVTLVGVGGGGKTRVAVQLAERLLGQHPDGVWFIDLAPLADPERVAQAVATVAGVREEPGLPLAQSLGSRFSGQRALLVLDNCEHLLDACVRLVDALLDAAPELKIVATSREGLGTRWEQIYAIPSLSMPEPNEFEIVDVEVERFEAVRLFVDRATLARPDFRLSAKNGAAVGEICRRLDGIPLAIELAAARMRLLSAEQIRSKLHDRFRLLASGGRSTLPRHQTLKAAIQWSYDHLTLEEQRMLRALSVFAGGWTLETATAICGERADEFEVLDRLTRLHDKSLIVVERRDADEPRYRLLETVRQYAHELLIEGGETAAAHTRHRDWFLGLAEQAAPQMTGPDQRTWFDRLQTENDNLRAAIDWCLAEDGNAESGLRLGVGMLWFWLIRGYLVEGRERLGALLAKDVDGAATAARGRALHGAGNLAFLQDDYAAARSYWEQALAVRESIGDRLGVAGSLGNLGSVAQYQGRHDEARSLFERSMEIFHGVGNRIGIATSLNCLGNVSRHLGDLEASRRYLDQAVVLTREIGNRMGESSSLEGLGELMMQLGDIEGAKRMFEQALAIEREIGDVHNQALTLGSLGLVARRQGDLALARSQCRTSLEMFHRNGARVQIAIALEKLAGLCALEGLPDRAARLWAAAAQLRQVVGASPSPSEQRELDQDVDAVRASLGKEAFDVAWGQGAAMGVDQAIALALAPVNGSG